jgi:hypothetical protein
VGSANDRRGGGAVAFRLWLAHARHALAIAFWSVVTIIDTFVIGSIVLAMIGFDGGVQLIIDAAYSVL